MNLLRRLCPSRELLSTCLVLLSLALVLALTIDGLFLWGVLPAVYGPVTVRGMNYDKAAQCWVLPPDAADGVEVAFERPGVYVRSDPSNEYTLPPLPENKEQDAQRAFYQSLGSLTSEEDKPQPFYPMMTVPISYWEGDPPPVVPPSEHHDVVFEYRRHDLRTPIFNWPLPDAPPIRFTVRCVRTFQLSTPKRPDPNYLTLARAYARLLQYSTTPNGAGGRRIPNALALLQEKPPANAGAMDLAHVAFRNYAAVVTLQDLPVSGKSDDGTLIDKFPAHVRATYPELQLLTKTPGQSPTKDPSLNPRTELAEDLAQPNYNFGKFTEVIDNLGDLEQRLLDAPGYQKNYGYGDLTLTLLELLDLMAHRMTAWEDPYKTVFLDKVDKKVKPLLKKIVDNLLAAPISAGEGMFGYRYVPKERGDGSWDTSVTQVVEYVLSRIYHSQFDASGAKDVGALLDESYKGRLAETIRGCRKLLQKCRGRTAAGSVLGYSGVGAKLPVGGRETLVGGYYAAVAGAYSIVGETADETSMTAAAQKELLKEGRDLLVDRINSPRLTSWMFYNQLFVGRAAQRIADRLARGGYTGVDETTLREDLRQFADRLIQTNLEMPKAKIAAAGGEIPERMYHCTLAMFYDSLEYLYSKDPTK